MTQRRKFEHDEEPMLIRGGEGLWRVTELGTHVKCFETW